MPNVSPTVPLLTPWGGLKVTPDPQQIFYEDFSVTPDIVNRWKSANGGTGSLPAWSAGQMNLVGGTTANSFSLFQTLRTFDPRDPGYLFFKANCNVFNNSNTAQIIPANNYVLIGMGTIPGTPTLAAPATDGCFFEFDSRTVFPAKMTLVVFQGGTRTVLPDMTIGQGGGSLLTLGDVLAHHYYMFFRGDSFFASYSPNDNFVSIVPDNNIVASYTTGGSGPNVNVLPLSFLVLSNGGTAANLQVNNVTLGDTARNTFIANNAVGNYPSAPTNITSAAADTAIAAANPRRNMLIVSNDSTSKLYLLIDPSGTGVASATNFTYVVPAGGTFEMPNPVSTARVRGIWSAANGSAGVTDVSMTATGI